MPFTDAWFVSRLVTLGAGLPSLFRRRALRLWDYQELTQDHMPSSAGRVQTWCDSVSPLLCCLVDFFPQTPPGAGGPGLEPESVRCHSPCTESFSRLQRLLKNTGLLD